MLESIHSPGGPSMDGINYLLIVCMLVLAWVEIVLNLVLILLNIVKSC